MMHYFEHKLPSCIVSFRSKIRASFFAQNMRGKVFVPLPLIRRYNPILCVNQFRIDKFLHGVSDIVHFLHPLKRVISF